MSIVLWKTPLFTPERVTYKEKYVYWPMKSATFSLLDPVPGTEEKDFCPMEVPPFHTWTLWSLSFLFFYFSLWFTVWKVMVILGFSLTLQINLTFRSVLCSLQNCLESMESLHAPASNSTVSVSAHKTHQCPSEPLTHIGVWEFPF